MVEHPGAKVGAEEQIGALRPGTVGETAAEAEVDLVGERRPVRSLDRKSVV